MKDSFRVYSSLEGLENEVRNRWSNEALKKEIECFVREVPQPMRLEPRTWLDRYIASPDHEVFRFLELSQKVGLKPLVVESLGDRFHRKNIDKMCLAKMTFLDAGKKNAFSTEVIDSRKNHMKPLSTIQTLWGESFVGFHHRLYHQYAIGVEHFNASDWFKFHGKSAKEYYPFLLSLFVCHGVLLEDFITNPDEEVFAQEVVLPSFQEVERRFGLRPLIARIYSDDELEETHSWCYPESMKEEVSRHAY